MEQAATDVKLPPSWKEHLAPEFAKPYMGSLKAFLQAELGKKKTIFPRGPEYFAAMNHTDFDQVRVVILGQDPYHGPGQAHGLCFSVKPGIDAPPSLKNIFKEMKSDLGIDQPGHGFLEAWAKQGVLLLNSVLTVEQGLAGSHANRGWETFTDAVIAALNAKREHVVFVLWGSYAQKKGQFIDRERHLVIATPHPSPLSASRGFLGSRPFSKINRYLEQTGQTPIDWRLPPLN